VVTSTGNNAEKGVFIETTSNSKKDKQSTKKGKKKASQGDDLDRALAELSLKCVLQSIF
jgi:restriction endonuclease Mrr